MQITDCRVFEKPPIGCLVFIDGRTASCGYCAEVVYPQLEVLRAHDFTWDGSRVTWYSRDFGVWVHRCADQVSSVEAVEIRELSSVG